MYGFYSFMYIIQISNDRGIIKNAVLYIKSLKTAKKA